MTAPSTCPSNQPEELEVSRNGHTWSAVISGECNWADGGGVLALYLDTTVPEWVLEFSELAEGGESRGTSQENDVRGTYSNGAVVRDPA